MGVFVEHPPVNTFCVKSILEPMNVFQKYVWYTNIYQISRWSTDPRATFRTALRLWRDKSPAQTTYSTQVYRGRCKDLRLAICCISLDWRQGSSSQRQFCIQFNYGRAIAPFRQFHINEFQMWWIRVGETTSHRAHKSFEGRVLSRIQCINSEKSSRNIHL